MQISLRSQLIAGVAVVGASAIAITPITQPDVLPTVHSPAIENVVFANPFIVFGPVMEDIVYDIGSLISGPVADPLPILRTVAVNQIANITDLIVATGAIGFGIGASVFNIPSGVINATAALLGGDVQGAIAALQTALIDPIAIELTYATIPRITAIVTRTVDHLTGVLGVLPSAALGIITATVNSITSTIGATVATGQQMLNELSVFNLEGVWTAAIDGLLGTTSPTVPGIIDTLRATTIGGGPTSISSAIKAAVDSINVALGGPASQLPQPAATTALVSGKAAAAEAPAPSVTSESATDGTDTPSTGSQDTGSTTDDTTVGGGASTKTSSAGSARRSARQDDETTTSTKPVKPSKRANESGRDSAKSGSTTKKSADSSDSAA